MDRLPLISVIMPAYNAEKTIVSSIESVVGQRHGNIELVVVDDGSQDDTLQIAEGLSEKDARIRVFPQTNGGVAKARNTGLGKASGEYIAFLDADDEYLENRFERQLEILERDKTIDLVFGRHRIRDEMTGQTRETHGVFPANTQDSNAMLIHLLKHGYFFNLTTALIKRTAIDREFDEQLKTAEDFDFVLHLAMQHRFFGIDEYTTTVRRGHDSLTQHEQKNIYRNERKVIQRFLRNNRRGLRPFLSAKSHQHLRFSKRYHTNNTRLSLLHGMASIAYNPLNDLAYKHMVMQLMLRRQ